MDSTTWITIILNLIIFAAIIYTAKMQKTEIASLKGTVSSLNISIAAQEKVINSMAKLSEIIDIEKYQKHIATFEGLVEKNAELTLNVMKSDLNLEFKQKDQMKEKRMQELELRYFDLLKFTLGVIIFVHPDDRYKLIKDFGIKAHEKYFENYLKKMENFWIYPSKYKYKIGLEEYLREKYESTKDNNLDSST